MTAIDTTTTCETWEYALSEPAAACEIKTGCDEAAEWRGIHTCCALSANLCDRHQKDFDEFQHSHAMQCSRCHHEFSVRWHRI